MLTTRRRVAVCRSCGSWGNIWLWKAACVFCGGSQIDKNNWLQCRLRLQCNSSAVQLCNSAILKLQMQHWRRRRRWRSNSVEFSVWHELQPICSVDEVGKENQRERGSGRRYMQERLREAQKNIAKQKQREVCRAILQRKQFELFPRSWKYLCANYWKTEIKE